MKGAEHHLHMRRFGYEGLPPYPNQKRLIRIVDRVVFLVGVVGPFFSLPQVFKIWESGETMGLSIETWVAYFVFSIVWFIYGIAHREAPIIISNGIYAVINFLIVLGIILFS